MTAKPKCATKLILSDKVANAVPNLSAKKSQEIVEGILSGIKETLAKGEEVKISGFGKFVLHDKNSRKGRNPQTGESITIEGRRVLRFKVSDKLKAEMNGGSIDGDDED